MKLLEKNSEIFQDIRMGKDFGKETPKVQCLHLCFTTQKTMHLHFSVREMKAKNRQM
jgi:hypothetical protein